MSVEESAVPGSLIYREGAPNPGNLRPRPIDAGRVSFRNSLSNPIPKGERAVFRPGEPYFAVDTSLLPVEKVIRDDNPPGHVSILNISPEDLRGAVCDRGKFPAEESP